KGRPVSRTKPVLSGAICTHGIGSWARARSNTARVVVTASPPVVGSADIGPEPAMVISTTRTADARPENHPMDHFHYRDAVLYCEDVPVTELADRYGTPLFVYSQATLLHHLGQLRQAFAEADPLVCYSIKINPNINICQLMAGHGAGFDVTSAG